MEKVTLFKPWVGKVNLGQTAGRFTIINLIFKMST